MRAESPSTRGFTTNRVWLVWIEHGHQYDGINAFHHLLYPHLPKSDKLMLPGGYFFVCYLFNRVGHKHPFADNMKPIAAYLKKYWSGLLFSLTVWQHLRYFPAIFRKVGRFRLSDMANLEREQKQRLQREADRYGLDKNRLQAIKNLWVFCFLYQQGVLANMVRIMADDAEGVYQRMAAIIQKEINVKYVILGHTHDVKLCSLISDGRVEYVNTGT